MSFVKRTLVACMLAVAVACAGAQTVQPKPIGPPRVPLRSLNDMIEKARADLAMRLGGTVEQVTLAGWQTVHLPARVLRCEVTKGDPGEAEVPGFRIVLVYKARDYTYHSDTKTVTACPRIELE